MMAIACARIVGTSRNKPRENKTRVIKRRAARLSHHFLLYDSLTILEPGTG